MAKKVLIVGGLGYLGSIITDLLYRKHYDVHVYDIAVFLNEDVDVGYGKLYTHKNFDYEEFLDFDYIVWCAHIDVNSFHDSVNIDIINFLHNVITLYTEFSIRSKKFINCSYYKGWKPSIKTASYFVGCKEINKKGLNLEIPVLYGPSPRMRWDTPVNNMIYDFITSKCTIVDNIMYRIPILNVFDCATFIVNNYIDSDLERDICCYKNYSLLEIAYIIRNVFPNKEELQIHVNDNMDMKYEEKEEMIKAQTSLEFSVKEILSQLDKNMFTDFIDERYNNEVYISGALKGLNLLERIK